MSISTSIWDAALTSIALIKSYLGTDAKEDAEPVHSTVYDIAANEWNKIVAGLSELALRSQKGNLATYQFSMPNATSGLTNSDLYRGTGGDTDLEFTIAPWDGSVVALAVRVENARSAGTLTAKVTVGGTEVSTVNVLIDGTNDQENYSVQLPDLEIFSAGDLLGVSITTDGTWAAGATPSVDCDMIVSYG